MTPTPEPQETKQAPKCAKCQDRRYLVAEGGYATECYYCEASPQEPQKDETIYVEIEWQREGRCLWHTNCPKRNGIMREVKREPERSLLECLNCGQYGYLPVGAVCARSPLVEPREPHAALIAEIDAALQTGVGFPVSCVRYTVSADFLRACKDALKGQA